ncbi:MAG: DNA polymerase III subunit chi [Rickettsiaceae bacterium]
MMKISCYKTTREFLVKTFCQLAEKCYYSAENTCVITDNADLTQELDQVLWTYSRKHFIPHATEQDLFAEKQPIYITSSIENPNKSKILIVINPTKEKFLSIISESNFTKYNSVTKLLIMLDDTQKFDFIEINNLLEKSHLQNFIADFFERTNKGTWQKVLNT